MFFFSVAPLVWVVLTLLATKIIVTNISSDIRRLIILSTKSKHFTSMIMLLLFPPTDIPSLTCWIPTYPSKSTLLPSAKYGLSPDSTSLITSSLLPQALGFTFLWRIILWNNCLIPLLPIIVPWTVSYTWQTVSNNWFSHIT